MKSSGYLVILLLPVRVGTVSRVHLVHLVHQTLRPEEETLGAKY